jgi:predicted anti-sigma-YlaC factor YlaD
VTCLVVRDRLVERSLAALSPEDATEVERHLAWCAACRKEAAELDRAAATFALTLAPEAPAPELEDRVVEAVRTRADQGSVPAGRPSHRGRLAAASVVAAMVAISALGWGVAMAGRAERASEQASAERQQRIALEVFKDVIGASVFEPGNHVYVGNLAPTGGRTGAGTALTLVSPSIPDIAVVTVSGLPVNDAAMPYRVWAVEDGTGTRLAVGKPIQKLDVDGSAMVVLKDPDRSLSAFRTIKVTDASGEVVLIGSVATEAALDSPAP